MSSNEPTPAESIHQIVETFEKTRQLLFQMRGQIITANLHVQQLEAALRDVREEICIGPVDDVLWHSGIPAETTVDFICNVLDDGWDYDEWLSQNENKQEGEPDGS